MRIALTGVSGFIGSVAAQHLRQAGHQVTGLVRKTSRRDHIKQVIDRFVVGDQSDEMVWPDLLRDADCLIHNSVDWGALRSGNLREHLERNLVASIRLIETAAERKVPKVIFISSVATLHEMSPAWNGVIDEDHPLRPGGHYGACKAAIEDHLWSSHALHGLAITIIRPSAVYGIDPNIERSIGYSFIEKVKCERKFDKPGGGKFVHVDDVAAVMRAATESERPAIVVNLADCYARWADIAKMAAEELGIQAEIDLSSPPQSKNQYSKEASRALGVPLDRGHEGIRRHVRELIARMK
jgi:nucleoside-diphosphate-sugar epimerase